MKRRFSFILVLLLLFSFSLNAAAVDFDVDQIYNSVFVIESGNSLGSGFAVDEQLIVTNAHVIDSQKNIIVHSYSNDTDRATLVGYDAEKDIAVLFVQNASYSAIKIGDTAEIKVGDDVYAIGAPKNLSYTLTKGIISNKNREFYGMSYLQIDAAVNAGNSGGPLLNSAGEVIGVNTLKMLDTEGIALSIPIETIMEFINSISVEPDNTETTTFNETTTVENETGTEQTDQPTNQIIAEEDAINKPIFYCICGIAAISMILNIVLFVLLIYNKKKDIVPQLDQRDRTDFEIDIME